MVAQAISGIAKDLNKMSAKSSIKLLIDDSQQSKLYRWVAVLTGSKNSLKGLGFFLGGALMTLLGFRQSLWLMMVALSITLILSYKLLARQQTDYKPKLSQILSKSAPINALSTARFFLFGSRDIWFVVALPVFLHSQLQWQHLQIGGFMAIWIIAYGLIQALAPRITQDHQQGPANGATLLKWVVYLAVIPSLIALCLSQGMQANIVLIIGLLVYGAIFAVNSSLHSYLIVAYAQRQSVSTDVGFYYMANAAGRLVGTLLSGLIYQQYGIISCLMASSAMVAISVLATTKLPR